MPVTYKCKRKPFSVGRPRVIEAVTGFIPGRTVGNLTYLLAFAVKDHQTDAIFDKGYFFAIGRELGELALNGCIGWQQFFFFNQCSIGEVLLFLTRYLSGV